MNISFSNRKSRAKALTLVETMVTMSVFSLVVLGTISLQVFGLKEYGIVGSKLGASDQSRIAFNTMIKDIRGSKIMMIGNAGGVSDFVPMGTNQLEQGTALKLYPNNDTNTYILYYFNTNASELRRAQGGISGYDVVAQYLTNTFFFKMEDYLGNPLLGGNYNSIVHVKLEFYQFKYPMTVVGRGYFYDYYKLEFRVASHMPD